MFFYCLFFFFVVFFFFFFFFQAEDGIRDLTVTGVQTCALPIWTDQQQSNQQLAEQAWRRQIHDERKQQVELFLDRQRPCSGKPNGPVILQPSHPEILKSDGIAPPGQRTCEQRRRATLEVATYQIDQDCEGIERQDSKRASAVKRAEVVW